MKIDLPHAEHNIQVLVNTPKGDVMKVLDSSHRSLEIELPEGVHEDEVEVLAVHLDDGGEAMGDMQYLKEAVEPEKEEDDEDDPVEADEEDAQSPPDEMVDEVAEEEELEDMDVDEYGESSKKRD